MRTLTLVIIAAAPALLLAWLVWSVAVALGF